MTIEFVPQLDEKLSPLERLEALVLERADEARAASEEADALRAEVAEQAGAIAAFQDVIARQREQLRSLDDRMLRDLGLTRADIMHIADGGRTH